MANIKSAKKRISVIEKKTARNRRVKDHLKETIKGFESALEEGDQKLARDYLAQAEKKLQQAASKGTIHQNAADRKVSRLTKAFVKAFSQDALAEKAETPKKPEKVVKPSRGKAKAKAPAKPEPVVEEEAVEETPAEETETKSTKIASLDEAEAAPEEAEAEAEVEEALEEPEAEAPAEGAAETESEEASEEEE